MANLAIVGTHSTNGVAEIHCRLLQTKRRAGFRRDVSRAIQQQDQRRHAAALAADGQPGPGATDYRSHRRGLDHRSGRIAKDRAAGRRRRLPRRLPKGQAGCQGPVRALAEVDLGPDRRSRIDLRLPDQAHSRIQAATAERIADHRALQPAAVRPEFRRCRRARSCSPAKRRRPTTWPS